MGFRMRTSQVAVFLACLAVAAGCSEDDGFVEPPSPASLTIVGGTPQTGTVSFPLGQTLRVRVTDDDGSPLGGILVTWAVASGGGSLATATSTTDGDGVAVNSWTLGSTEGPQTVTASAEGTNAVTFTATAGPRSAFLLQRAAGNAQVGLPGDVVNPIQARLLDANGLPLAGVRVTWTVTGGGGSVNPNASTTNSLGIATTLWTLGPTGPQTLTATAPGAGTLTFTAASDECARVRTFDQMLGAGRSLDTGDCRLATGPRAGSFIEFFSFAPTVRTNSTFTMSSSSVDAFFAILRGADTVARNNNASATTTDAQIRIFMGPGTYRFGATSAVANQTGAYTFTQGAVGEVTGCVAPFITRGAEAAQTIAVGDCLFSGWYGDQYQIYLKVGEAVTISQAGTGHTNYLILYTPSGAIATEGGSSTPGATATISHTATVAGFYLIDVSTWNTGELGPYTLTIGT